jgi:ABC-2 type transport system ATP-binding protein
MMDGVSGAAIEVEGLRKTYDGREAVRGIDFSVARGEVFGLLGPNGAGKTTTVEILEGYRARSAGSVSVLGHDPGDRPAGLRERVGIVLQSCGTYPHLSVRETVTHWASLYPAPRDVGEVITLAGLDEAADRRARTASSGGSISRWRSSATPSWSSSTSRPSASIPRRGAPRGTPCGRCARSARRCS